MFHYPLGLLLNSYPDTAIPSLSLVDNALANLAGWCKLLSSSAAIGNYDSIKKPRLEHLRFGGESLPAPLVSL